jgi:hypothetical protein
MLALFNVWRVFWAFSLRPRLRPEEPKELPYWIAFVGHATSFFSGFTGTIEKGRQHYHPSREPFTMRIVGQTIFVATAPEDVNAVWKDSRTMSMTPITEDMYDEPESYVSATPPGTIQCW